MNCACSEFGTKRSVDTFGILYISNVLKPLDKWYFWGNPETRRWSCSVRTGKNSREREGTEGCVNGADLFWLGWAGPGLCEQKLQEPSASSTYPSDVAPDDVTFAEDTAGKLRTGNRICSLNCEFSWLFMHLNQPQRCWLLFNLIAVPVAPFRTGHPIVASYKYIGRQSLPRREHHSNFFFWWFNHNIDNFIKNYKTDIKKISNS